MTPKQLYQQALDNQTILPDPQQQQVVIHLQEIYEKLQASHRTKFPFRLFKKETIKGIYIWGPVGAGKTWLMDLFYQSIDNIGKKRLHFHQFMRNIHQQLRHLQGRTNPLAIIAKNLAKEIRLLCFDEFYVTDIADAMLLAGLLQALFAEGIVFMATSNVAPDDLYRNGLQRERFLPAIDLLKQHTTVIHLSNKKDYRLRTLAQANVYFFPNDANAHEALKKHFLNFAGQDWQLGEDILIANRPIPTIAKGRGIVWFDFKDLCHVPRSQIDYLEIAQQFDMVLLSNVPKLSKNQDNEVTYLINLVDIFYDEKVKLIIAAEVPVTELYESGRLQTIFQRTISRLIEMQSNAYLQTPRH